MDKKQKYERVMVNIRIRPFNDDELKLDSSSPIQVDGEKIQSKKRNKNKQI